MARYVVIGAGAVGGTIGGMLFSTGHEVVLVARGAHYEALRQRGLRLAAPGRTSTHHIPVIRGPAALAVKTQHSTALLEEWADRPVEGGGRAGDRLPMVCAQNGVENERLALRRFDRVYAMCVWVYSSHLQPGVVAAFGVPGVLLTGRYPAGVDEMTERISADLSWAAFTASAVPDIMRWKYAKLLSNLGNALEALCGPENGDEMSGLYRWVVAEGEKVLAAAEVNLADPAELLAGLRYEPIDGVHRGGGSSWQSLGRTDTRSAHSGQQCPAARGQRLRPRGKGARIHARVNAHQLAR